ncbi:uncharacterized protein LOC142223797 [Haematobia irritans]|uniref:uncharacterized protein LOC142223797 n=1 Tax=Haematobia irritans TaxID=7368 RepID=UPI003F5016A3
MAPAQILDFPQNRTNYTHKKFQGKQYAHKKFGTRSPSPVEIQNMEIITQHSETSKILMDTRNTQHMDNANKKSSNDIFRPYALEEPSTTRKRKYQDIQDEHSNNLDYNTDYKRFAHSPPVYQQPLVTSLSSPAAALPFAPTFLPLPTPPTYSLRQYNFSPQTFAMVLQKQQAALCMGEILKRQTNFYPQHNIMGN